jgi:FkbM family methyltransferase
MEPSVIALTEIRWGEHHFRVSMSHPDEPAFWASFNRDEWEPQTLAVLRAYVKPGMRFLDIGAWIGPISLAAASLGAQVSAYEPDPEAFSRLAANVAANPHLRDRIEVHNAGVWTYDGQHSIAPGPNGFGDQMSSLILEGKERHDRKIRVVDGARLQADFVKIDIEGGEFEVVPHVARSLFRDLPSLLLSTHAYRTRSRFGKTSRRLKQARRMAPILWAVRRYRRQYEVTGSSASGLQQLKQWGRIRALLSLGERELFFTQE